MLDGVNLGAGIYALILLIFLYFYEANTIFIVIGFSLLFFLIKNYQNKLFLGNNGSYLLGFVISFFFINLNNKTTISAEEIFLVMSIPGFDMLRLYSQRIYNKKNPFKADLNHLHHLLLKKFSYNRAIICLLLILSIPIIFSFFFKDTHKIYLIIIIVFFYSCLIGYLLKKRVKR